MLKRKASSWDEKWQKNAERLKASGKLLSLADYRNTPNVPRNISPLQTLVEDYNRGNCYSSRSSIPLPRPR